MNKRAHTLYPCPPRPQLAAISTVASQVTHVTIDATASSSDSRANCFADESPQWTGVYWTKASDCVEPVLAKQRLLSPWDKNLYPCIPGICQCSCPSHRHSTSGHVSMHSSPCHSGGPCMLTQSVCRLALPYPTNVHNSA